MSREDFQNIDEQNISDYTNVDGGRPKTEAEKMMEAEHDAILQEAAIESPTRMMVKSFFSNKLGVIGLIGFLAVFLVVFLGSALIPYDPYYSQPVLKNLSPGAGYMAYPSEMEKEGVVDIQVGTTFAAGLTQEGNVYFWGHEIADNVKPPAEF